MIRSWVCRGHMKIFLIDGLIQMADYFSKELSKYKFSNGTGGWDYEGK